MVDHSPIPLGSAGQPRYLPIADYGVIGDTRSIALVSRTGSIDWWCLPRFDGDPVFARLLDADRGGCCSIHPLAPFQAQQSYLGQTNILMTEFSSSTGTARLLDFMPALTEAQKQTYPVPYREIIRRVEGCSGHVVLQLRFSPRPKFGSCIPRARQLGDGRYVFEWGAQALHLASSTPLRIDAGTLTTTIDLPAGSHIDLALSYARDAPAGLPTLNTLPFIQQLTESFWHGWSGACRYTGPYREAVLRSALILKLLTYAPSGAIIAAPTTSLPEQIGGVRNWDYRYCWLRDAAFTIRALLSLGYQSEAHAFAEWLLYATQLTHPELQVVYTIFGRTDIPEKIIGYLEGYRGSRPVRVGNAATDQFQLDVYGEVLNALLLYRRSGGRFDRDGRRLISGMAQVLVRRWAEPDDGIWEVRSGRAQHIHSKIMAWVGLERAIELGRIDGIEMPINRITTVCGAIRSWVLEHGFDPAVGAFTRTPGDGLDASLLVIPIMHFLDPHDRRVVQTVEAIQRRLADQELVYRYRGTDGLPGGEGAFVICSFWLVEALAHLGRLDEARANFERLLARRTRLGLLAE
ncbi:glycoside hydrolase family 15 protein, partial [Nitrolancea hollandica]|uniref:glycoside hydrolase family 15 protein n=1 Tax=Nitrolancea hollandica TaxID=1206749 RepID=UPI000687AA18